MRVRRANTNCVTSLTIFVFCFAGIVTNHFASRTLLSDTDDLHKLIVELLACIGSPLPRDQQDVFNLRRGRYQLLGEMLGMLESRTAILRIYQSRDLWLLKVKSATAHERLWHCKDGL